jgi:hypothetical protein
MMALGISGRQEYLAPSTATTATTQ